MLGNLYEDRAGYQYLHAGWAVDPGDVCRKLWYCHLRHDPSGEIDTDGGPVGIVVDPLKISMVTEEEFAG